MFATTIISPDMFQNTPYFGKPTQPTFYLDIELDKAGTSYEVSIPSGDFNSMLIC